MFTGLITEQGTISRLRRAEGIVRLVVHAPRTAPRLAIGESIAINGVCLSLVSNQRGMLTFEAIPETQRLTNLGRLAVGDRVNVEPSLTLSDRLNGHLVLGHVDGLGTIRRRAQRAGEVAIEIQVGRDLRRSLVPKAPIAIDGVSLTVGSRLTSTTCMVFLIPETMRKTTLGECRVGDAVNIELDYIAKLITQFAKPTSQQLTQLLRGVTKYNRHAALD